MINNTLQSRLTIYSIILILITTSSAIIGAILLEIYQTERDHQQRLLDTMESFQQDFTAHLDEIEEYWQKFADDPQRTSTLATAILYAPYLDDLPIQFTQLSTDLDFDQVAFYFASARGEADTIKIFYDKAQGGTILILSKKWDNEQILFTREATGLMSQVPTDVPIPFSTIYQARPSKHQLEIWDNKIALNSHLLYTNTAYEDPAIGVIKGSHIGNMVSKMKLDVFLQEMERRMGVRLSLFDIEGNTTASSGPLSRIPFEAGKVLPNITEVRDENDLKYTALFQPLHYQGQLIGYAATALSQEATVRKIKETILLLVLIALGVLVMIIPMSRLLVTKLSQPLTEISGLFKEFTKSQNYSLSTLTEHFKRIQALPPLLRGREFTNLSNSFLHVMEVVEAQTNTIAAQNQALEQKVREIGQKNIDLEKLDRLKDDFLANTSHELRTPLHGIIGIADILLNADTIPRSEEEKRHLSMIISNGRRLSNMIDDLLDIYKMQEQGIQLDRGPLLLQSLVDAVMTFTHTMLDDRPVELLNRVPSDVVVLADEGKLEQVLYNLVSNAIKYTQSGKVVIRTEAQGNRILIAVEDTGIGIPPDKLKGIFDIFTQVNEPINHEIKGTGLGLSITKRLIESHESTLEVSSTVGVGSVFSFSLPKATNFVLAEEGHGRNHFEISKSRGRFPDPLERLPMDSDYLKESSDNADGPEILIVDDEPTNLEILSSSLSKKGYRVVQTTSGRQALDFLEERTPDLILLDLMMPHMNGYEVCQAVRQKWDLITLPIIMLSAKNQLQDLEKGFLVGANDYLTKPFFAREVLSRIKTLLLAKETVVQLKENRRLLEVLEQKEQLQNELEEAQARMTSILDTLEDAIVCLNLKGDIVFFNGEAATLLGGYSETELLRQPFSLPFPECSLHQLLEMKASKSSQVVVVQQKDGQKVKSTAFFSSFHIETEEFITLIFPKAHPSSVPTSPAPPSGLAPWELIQDNLQQQQGRIAALEKVLSESFQSEAQLPTPEKEPTKSSTKPSTNSSTDSRSELESATIAVMRQTLDYWENSTGKSKIDLAEESGIWHINIDGGTYKTRTLDRYLSHKNFPRRPRVREVLKTAHYVLKECPPLDGQAQTLETTMHHMQSALELFEKQD